MSDHKLKALGKLLALMKSRTGKKMSIYGQGAKMSGMAGYLPEMNDGKNAKLQKKKIEKAKPYDRIEKDK